MVGNGEPFDAVDLGDLAAGQARGGLGARLVVGVPHVDGLLARLPLVGLEDEGAGADELADLLGGVGVGDALGHHQRRRAARLGQRIDHQAIGLLQHDLERLVVHGLEAGDEAQQFYAQRVARAPAFQRGDAVLRRHRLAVVPFEAVAEREGVDELVRTQREAVDHLRLGHELVVHGEQRVPHHVAVVAHDVGGGPDRIEHFQV